MQSSTPAHNGQYVTRRDMRACGLSSKMIGTYFPSADKSYESERTGRKVDLFARDRLKELLSDRQVQLQIEAELTRRAELAEKSIQKITPLLNLGLRLIPLKRKTKRPRVRWKPLRGPEPPPQSFYLAHFAGGRTNIAIIVGECSGGLAIRDFDTRMAYYKWRKRFPQTAAQLPTVKTRRGFHVYVRTNTLLHVGRFGRNILNLGNGELKLRHGYTLAPGSIHPSGILYEWHSDNGNPPTQIPYGEDLTSIGLAPTPQQWDTYISEIEKRNRRKRKRAQRKRKEKIKSCAPNPDSPPSAASDGAPEFFENERLDSDDLSELEKDNAIELAIAVSLPTSNRSRHKQLIPFCARLKAHPELSDLSDDELDGIAARYWLALKKQLGREPNTDLFQHQEEVRTAYASAFPWVPTTIRAQLNQLPATIDSLRTLIRWLQEYRIKRDQEWTDYRCARCFPLSVRKVAYWFSDRISKSTAHRWIKQLVKERYIVPVHPTQSGPRAPAQEYFCPSCFLEDWQTQFWERRKWLTANSRYLSRLD